MKPVHVVITVRCSYCKGKGTVRDPQYPDYGLVACPVCRGRKAVREYLPWAEFLELLRSSL